MIQEITPSFTQTLDTYAADILLTVPVNTLRGEAATLTPALKGRTVWMVNSTPKGGGVAEMLPKMVHLLKELGVDIRWAVIGTEHHEFFSLTKRLHNAIHGECPNPFIPHDETLYRTVGEELAAEFAPRLKPHDILVVHDPQPAAMGAILRRQMNITAIWRSHIGIEKETPATKQAWNFLKPYLKSYDHSVFSAPAYIPPYLSKSVSIIQPSIDPLSHKNRHLHPVKLVGILDNAGLFRSEHPVLTPPFDAPAKRLTPSGDFLAHNGAEDIGLLSRPVVTQVSRWDRLKGWLPLLEAFERFKNRRHDGQNLDTRCRQRINICRLVLAGPEPDSVQDDPEALSVLEEITERYKALPEEIQEDVAILSLPMSSLKHNALIVNALQRASSLVVQNSIKEGFGLVVTEAMWKRTPVLASSAYGLRRQIRDGVDGKLIADATDPASIEASLREVLHAPKLRAAFANSARHQVFKHFLIFRQLGEWLQLLNNVEQKSNSNNHD